MTINHNLMEPLVETLRRGDNLADPRVEAAFRRIPRELFLRGVPESDVYSDKSVPVRVDHEGVVYCDSIMPSVIAQMLNRLELQAGHNVLEIGTGTGYTAVLARAILGDHGHVTTMEIDPDIAQLSAANIEQIDLPGIHLVQDDGANGYAPNAPYDRIVSTVGVWDLPPVWVQQLKPDGRMVVPVWIDGLQVLATFIPQGDGTLYSDFNKPSAFVYIRGAAAGPNVWKRVGSTSLTLFADDVEHLDMAAMHMLLSSDADSCHLSAPLDSSDYWYGFLPYLMINEPDTDIFGLYDVVGNRAAYGVDGSGFAYFTPASAVFVPYLGLGYTYCFAGADAFLAVEDALNQWQDAGRPAIDMLRLRLVPRDHGRPQITSGKVYERRDHYLHVWQETG
jgi:protein-L-isoaspartate(D-aspartate) O-methyltransferase